MILVLLRGLLLFHALCFFSNLGSCVFYGRVDAFTPNPTNDDGMGGDPKRLGGGAPAGARRRRRGGQGEGWQWRGVAQGELADEGPGSAASKRGSGEG